MRGVDYCALFFYERCLKTDFDRRPSGMNGAQMALQFGEY
jgi:hypothetical protein